MIGFDDDAVFMNTADFGISAIIKIGRVSRIVSGIFDDKSSGIDVASGFIQAPKITFMVSSKLVCNIAVRDTVTIKRQCFIVVEPPSHDGSGFCLLTLSKHDAEQKSTSSIQY